jgi:hypothetical protein
MDAGTELLLNFAGLARINDGYERAALAAPLIEAADIDEFVRAASRSLAGPEGSEVCTAPIA